MGFIKFVIGVFLGVGSIIFGIMLMFGVPFVMQSSHSLGFFIFLAVVVFIAFLGGIWLVRHH